MNKPITVVADEFNNQLVNLVNNSGLPFFIIENIMKDLLSEIHSASKKQLEIDRTKYNDFLKQSKAESDGELL